MTALILPAVALYLLACLDGAFAGFRSAAGRNPRLFKGAWHRRHMLRGLGYSQLAALVVVAFTAATTPDVNSLQYGILAMLQVYSIYGGAALLALAVYLLPHPDISSLATVLVLGPLTLLRVPVIVAGAGWAVLQTRDLPTAACATVAAAVMVLAEPVLSLQWRRWSPLPAPDAPPPPGSSP